MRMVLLICISIFFEGCSKKCDVPDISKQIETLLDFRPVKQECIYPRLPVFAVPPVQKIPEGMNIKEAFVEQNKVNKKLRRVCSKYRRVAIETNKRYQKKAQR